MHRSLGAVAVAVWLAGGEGAVAALVVRVGCCSAWALATPRIPVRLRRRATSSSGGPCRSPSASSSPASASGCDAARNGRRTAAASEERTRLRVERLQALAASLSAALTVEQVAGVMVEGVPAAIGASGGALGLIEGDELVIVDPRGARGQTLRPGTRLPLTTRAPITTAAREGKPAWVQRRQEFVSRFADGAALAPYASGALARAGLRRRAARRRDGVSVREPDAITAEVRTVARIAADLGGQALERAGLYELGAELARGARSRSSPSPRASSRARRRRPSPSRSAPRRAGRSAATSSRSGRPIDDDAARGDLARPAERRDPSRDADRLRDFPGLIDEMRAFRSMFVPNAQQHTRGRGAAARDHGSACTPRCGSRS